MPTRCTTSPCDDLRPPVALCAHTSHAFFAGCRMPVAYFVAFLHGGVLVGFVRRAISMCYLAQFST